MTSTGSSANTGNKAPETKADVSQNKESVNNKEFESIYGKHPSQEYVLKKLQGSETFKDCKTYEDAMKIVKEKEEGLYNRLQKNALSKAEIEKTSANMDLEKIYGKNPVEANVLKKLKEIQPDVYNRCNTYDEAMEILKDRRPPTYEWLKKNTSYHHPLQDADEKTLDQELADRNLSPADIARQEAKQEQAKTDEIAKKKEELFKPEAKPAETKPTATEQNEGVPQSGKPKKGASRWTQADEAAWPGSKKTPKQEPKKEESPKEEKPKKAGGGFFKKIFRPVSHPRRTVKLLTRTAVTPVGLLNRKLADIGEKEKTGAKDRFGGFKKIAKGEKK